MSIMLSRSVKLLKNYRFLNFCTFNLDDNRETVLVGVVSAQPLIYL